MAFALEPRSTVHPTRRMTSIPAMLHAKRLVSSNAGLGLRGNGLRPIQNPMEQMKFDLTRAPAKNSTPALSKPDIGQQPIQLYR